MQDSEQYPFTPADSALGEASLRPYLPITLTYQNRLVTTSGLLDTGSIDRIEGNIAPGEKIKVFTKLSPGRAFPAKVTDFVLGQIM